MKRIDSFGALAGGFFGHGDPGTATPATRVTAPWLNDVQENICHVIEQAGISLAGEYGDYSQLYDAILALIDAHAGEGGGGGGGGGPYLLLAGGTMAGFITLHQMPTATMHAAPKAYVDAAINALAASLPNFGDFLLKSGGTMSGYIILHNDPTEDMHPATKRYVDNLMATVSSPITNVVEIGPLNPAFNGGITSAAHTLGGYPKFMEAVLRCIANDGGWAVGDEVSLSSLSVVGAYNVGSEGDPGGHYLGQHAVTPFRTTTHCGVRFGNPGLAPSSGAFAMQRKDQTIGFYPNTNSWRLYFRAGR